MKRLQSFSRSGRLPLAGARGRQPAGSRPPKGGRYTTERVSEIECVREAEILAAVASGCWPDRCAEELRAHAALCAVCAGVADVAVMFQAEAENVRHEAHIPTAAHVWWRAQMRARQEAAHAAGRPITVVQGLAAASATGLAVAAIGYGWPSSSRALPATALRLGQLAQTMVLEGLSFVARTPELALMCGAALGLVVLLSVAVYVVLIEE